MRDVKTEHIGGCLKSIVCVSLRGGPRNPSPSPVWVPPNREPRVVMLWMPYLCGVFVAITPYGLGPCKPGTTGADALDARNLCAASAVLTGVLRRRACSNSTPAVSPLCCTQYCTKTGSVLSTQQKQSCMVFVQTLALRQQHCKLIYKPLSSCLRYQNGNCQATADLLQPTLANITQKQEVPLSLSLFGFLVVTCVFFQELFHVLGLGSMMLEVLGGWA